MRQNAQEEDFLAYVTLTMRTLTEASLTAAFMFHKWYLYDEKITWVLTITIKQEAKISHSVINIWQNNNCEE